MDANRRTFLSALALGASALQLPLARAQAPGNPVKFPLRLVTVVVPFPPGGGTDAVARITAEALRGGYAENVVVENRAGAGGRIGVEYVKNKPADGSTLLYTPAFTIAIFPHIYKNLSYDALKDFVPVAATSKGVHALVIGPAVPASVKTLGDFVAWCKANPKAANFGTASGSSQHFVGASFARAAGIELPLIPYKGGAPALVDLLGGQIAATVSPMTEVLPLAHETRLRVLATTGTSRSRFTPDVPTMSELGYKDVVFQDWSGYLTPAHTPPEVVARANEYISAFVGSPKGVEALTKLGAEADAQSPEQFAATVKQSWERYRTVVKQTGFTAED